jgi:hypothetical protein
MSKQNSSNNRVSVQVRRPTVQVQETTAPAQVQIPKFNTVARTDIAATSDAATVNPKVVSVQLPSKFYFYDFKTLTVSPLLGYHQAKFARAAAEKNHRHMAEAVSTLLHTADGLPVSTLDLTIPDYYWLLYWLRINHYTRSPLTHVGFCNNPDHLKKIKSGELKPETLKTIVTINRTTLTENEFDYGPVAEFVAQNGSALESTPFAFHPATVRDLLELEDIVDTSPDITREIDYLADIASYLKYNGEDASQVQVSLKDRIELVQSLTVDELETVCDYRDHVQDYGVIEQVKFTCKECGAAVENEISIAAHSFL